MFNLWYDKLYEKFPIVFNLFKLKDPSPRIKPTNISLKLKVSANEANSEVLLSIANWLISLVIVALFLFCSEIFKFGVFAAFKLIDYYVLYY